VGHGHDDQPDVAGRRRLQRFWPPALLFVGVVALGGFSCYWLVQRHRTGVLAEHQAPAQEA
jgi:hypothetical protein